MSDDRDAAKSKKRRVLARRPFPNRRLVPRARPEPVAATSDADPDDEAGVAPEPAKPKPKTKKAKSKSPAPPPVGAGAKPAPKPVAPERTKPTPAGEDRPVERSAADAPKGRIGGGTIAIAAAFVAGALYLSTRAPSDPPPISAASASPSVVAPIPATQRKLFDAIPAGAFVVITADIRALRASPLAAPYLGGGQIPGFDDVRGACGFDPIGSVDEIAIAIPESGQDDLGIVATGGFSDTQMIDCAAKVVSARGGQAMTSTSGAFRTVRDAKDANSTETAARAGGLLLRGRGAYLKTMIDAANGTIPNVGQGSLHASLRSELSGYETVQATVALSKEQRQLVADEITKAQGRAPDALGFVSGAALGARLVGDKASLLLVVVADDASQAPKVRDWLESAKTDASSSLPSKLLGVAPLLGRIQLEVSGPLVRARLDATVTELEGIVDRALKLRALLQQPPPAPPGSGSPSVAPPSSVSAPPASASAAPGASAGPGPAPVPKKKKKPKPNPGEIQ